MSGIGGIFQRDGKPLLIEHLSLLKQSLKHRGAKNYTLSEKECVGLIQCDQIDLPTYDTSTFDGGKGDHYLISFSGRIDNIDEISKLVSIPSSSSTISDCDLLLAAYRTWGADCLAKLLGDFSFCIWDNQNQSLFCARDAIGVKPFYYYVTEDVFIFSSEINGLLAIPTISSKLDDYWIADYFTIGSSDKVATPYKKIRRLPPGHFISISSRFFHVRQYYTVTPLSYNYTSPSDYEDHFRELFFQAVNRRLRTDKRIGSFLSGGLDSSSITCVASTILESRQAGPLTTFSGIFSKLVECDEQSYFSSITSRYPIEPHLIDVDSLNPRLLMDEVITIAETPLIGSHFFMMAGLLNYIQRNNVNVMLDGHDGDAAISYGNRIFIEMALKLKILSLYKELKINRSNFKRTIGYILSLYKNIFHFSFPVNCKKDMLNRYHLQLHILRSDYKQRIDIYSLLHENAKFSPKYALSEREYHRRNISHPLQTAAIEAHDLFFSKHMVVPRYPFFDKQLIEFCLGLSAHQKFKDGRNRDILRRSLKDFLPSSICNRLGKTDFSPSLVRAFWHEGYYWLKSAIDSAPEISYKYINYKSVHKDLELLKHLDSGKFNIRLKLLLKVAVFNKWLVKIKAHQ